MLGCHARPIPQEVLAENLSENFGPSPPEPGPSCIQHWRVLARAPYGPLYPLGSMSASPVRAEISTVRRVASLANGFAKGWFRRHSAPRSPGANGPLCPAGSTALVPTEQRRHPRSASPAGRCVTSVRLHTPATAP